MKITSILFLILFFTAACGGDHHSNSKKVVPIAPERMEDILDQQSFRCRSASGKNCPHGIGRLFIINPSDPSNSAVCTGFLISEDRMLTNHHCVSSQRACDNTYISVNTPAGPVKSRCRDVLYARANSEVTLQRAIDFTVMQIDSVVPGPYFTVSSTRQDPPKESTAWVIDHVDILRANITELTCQYDSRQASLVMRNCPAIPGNSGSPIVLKGTKQAFAIIWGSNVPPYVDATYPMDLRLELDALSLATELFPLLNVINQ